METGRGAADALAEGLYLLHVEPAISVASATRTRKCKRKPSFPFAFLSFFRTFAHKLKSPQKTKTDYATERDIRASEAGQQESGTAQRRTAQRDTTGRGRCHRREQGAHPEGQCRGLGEDGEEQPPLRPPAADGEATGRHCSRHAQRGRPTLALRSYHQAEDTAQRSASAARERALRGYRHDL